MLVGQGLCGSYPPKSATCLRSSRTGAAVGRASGEPLEQVGHRHVRGRAALRRPRGVAVGEPLAVVPAWWVHGRTCWSGFVATLHVTCTSALLWTDVDRNSADS